MMLRCYAINTNYVQARVGYLSDAAPIKTIANSELKTTSAVNYHYVPNDTCVSEEDKQVS